MKNIVVLLFLIGIQFKAICQIDTLSLKTIDGITSKMIELISGDIGEDRNWEEYRNLFLPTAQKISLVQTKEGKSKVRVMNLEEFVRKVGPFYSRDGFKEYAIGLTVNEFNGIATVFQSYYCKNLIGTYEKRGINSYQLVFLENRWWIANTLFTPETEESKIPDKYLFKKYKVTEGK
ncbi:hypothetical protein [Aquimarina mytili]|uniref:Nuclear transport factor 2 family protein n=1 Tax=Aquimarina mytili TaxID=874423 RepID=A0A936ZW95_9FLAO|nr:hypothetical protein [Aquimarina mytili]MBL0683145.1 hypothetical protein [Aquimarina mytili]